MESPKRTKMDLPITSSICLPRDDRRERPLEDDDNGNIVEIKYLRLITDKPIVNKDGRVAHMTFGYFGPHFRIHKVFLNRFAMTIHRSFLLKTTGIRRVGVTHDKFAMTYDFDSRSADGLVNAVRECLLRVLGDHVVKENFLPWCPHITELDEQMMKDQSLEEIRVLGIESNDGKTWRYVFED